MSDYLWWNDTLAAHFFNPEMESQPVYLYVNEEIIAEIGSPIRAGVPELILAVKKGPPWATREGLCQRALQAYENWKLKGLAYPPYIAYLCVFVLAAGLEGEFAPHAYYPRLRHLLDAPGEGMLPSFDRMYELWEDLEQWAAFEKQSSLGIFKAQVVGEWIHVGYPLAQAILSKHERAALPWIFAKGGLDPTSPPPPDELARVLLQHGERHLRRRNLSLLRSRDDEERHRALLEAVADELAEWDGQVSGEAEAALSSVRGFGTLRLCLEVDRVARRAKVTLRCRLNWEFPEGGLVLTAPARGPQFRCEEFMTGWSTVINDATTGMPVDAAQFDWSGGLVLKDELAGWEFRLQGRPVRIFVEGIREGLPGLVEVHAFPRSTPFFLAFQEEAWKKLAGWAREGCREFADLAIAAGLPSGWRLASVREVVSDAGVRGLFPYLSLPATVRTRLTGGIRSSAGNWFFAFAPPSLSLDGGDGREEVWCLGQKLSPIPGKSVYKLPQGLPTETRITVEVQRDERELARVSFYLTGDFSWQWVNPLCHLDRWGVPLEEPGPRDTSITGATVTGAELNLSRFKRPVIFVANELNHPSTRRIFFVGRAPGEVACWPEEPLPSNWDPVWAIYLTRQGAAVYCGGSLDEAMPLATPTGDRDRVSLWKDILWHQRKRVTPPVHPALQKLWKQYREIARYV